MKKHVIQKHFDKLNDYELNMITKCDQCDAIFTNKDGRQAGKTC